MKPNLNFMNKSVVSRISIGLLAVAGLAAAQEQAPHAWRSVNDSLPAELDQAPAPPDAGPVDPQLAQRPDAGRPDYGPADQQRGQYAPAPYAPQNDNYGVPPRLTIKPGTYVTVRINQWLSSDRNQQGDAFTATLEQPIIVDGIVVAQRGQMVSGRVSEAQKAGRVEGTSRLAVQLTDLTLVDGQQAPIQSQMINRNGPTSTGRDAAAIGGTTALGAIIGAGADNGRGAAIGAGAGAAAGIIGVLLTRGRPTVIYPESVLTFRVEAPITVATDRAPQAFRYVDSQDYGRTQARMSRPPAPSYYDGAAPPPPPPAPYYPYGYSYPYPYYGGGISLFVGPRYGYGYGYGRGYYGGFRYRR